MNVACNGFEIDEKKRVTVCDEGEVVLFTAPVEGKVTEIYVTVLPKQRGTGDPTPSNIRPIEGYEKAVIHHLTDLREVDYVSNLKDVVYSGTIDLEKGIVTTEYAILNIDGSKTVGAVPNHPNSFIYSLGAECIAPNARGVQSTGWCTHYKVLTDVNSSEFYSEDKAVAYANTSLSAVVGRAIFTDTDYSSAADFKAFLQEQASKGTPVQIVFRLEEPVTFECDPLSIRTVSGSNHLVSEDGIIHACLEYFEDTEEPSESVTMPFGCQIGCTVSEYHTVEPLPVEERDPKDVCPPGMPNKWDIDDIPHAEGYCEGQGMDCVCNPMAIVTGIPCYKTIYVDSLPEEGMIGVMYVMPFEDKYAVYIWDGNEFQSATSTAVIEPLSVTPSSSAQDIEPVGADGFSPVHVDAVPQGALAPPTIEYGTNLGSGVIWSHSSVGVGGYIQQGQSIDRFDYCSQILPTENGKTVTPTTSEQVAVAANKWTNGQIKVGPIPPEYIVPTGTKQITSNGNAQDVAAYEKVNVNVPNSYAAADEGKVVSNGALVAQTSDTCTSNGVVDTTLINSLTVNVSGGGSDLAAVVGRTIVNLSDSSIMQIGAHGLEETSTLETLSLPNCTKLYKNALYNCTNLTSVSLPKVSSLSGSYQFASCSKITAIALPALTGQTQTYLFQSCSYLASVDLYKTTKLAQQVFASCTRLKTIVLRRDTAITTLDGTNAFSNTPFKSGGSGGTIYIPKVLYDHLGDGTALDYQNATNWSTVHGYGTITWAKIEGSYYETHYADGTPIS